MAALNAAARASGPSLLEQVFEPSILGALERVRLRARHASGERPGHTPVRGRSDPSGTDLERHTPYSPGDDLRRVDWNTYARLGELFTRRFVAEREVPVLLAIDASGSMGPAGPESKLDMAAAVAAIVGTVALSGGDRVYLAAISGRGGVERARCGPLRARRSLNEMHAFLSGLAPSDGPADLAAGLEKSLRDLRRGLVFVISDFLFDAASIARALDALGARHCEGKIVQVLSREDRDPSWLHGRDTLVDRETGEEFRVDPSSDLLHRYEAAMAAHVAEVARAAASRAMTSAVTISDVGLRAFLREDLARLGLRLVR